MDPGKLKHSPIFGSPQLKTNKISVEGLEGNSVAPIDRRDMGPLLIGGIWVPLKNLAYFSKKVFPQYWIEVNQITHS